MAADTDGVLAEVQAAIDECRFIPIDEEHAGPDVEPVDEMDGWSQYEIGVYFGHPECCVRAFDGGFVWVDAAIEFFHVHRMRKEHSEEAITQIGHIQCPKCITQWRVQAKVAT